MFDFRPKVERMGEVTRVTIPCDDGTGGQLSILMARDGDLHFSMGYDTTQPNAIDDLRSMFKTGVPVHMCNVRLRSGIGGGSHPSFHLALAEVFNQLVAKAETEGGARDGE